MAEEKEAITLDQQKKIKAKKGLLSEIIDKLDKKLEEKSKQKSCCCGNSNNKCGGD